MTIRLRLRICIYYDCEYVYITIASMYILHYYQCSNMCSNISIILCVYYHCEYVHTTLII